MSATDTHTDAAVIGPDSATGSSSGCSGYPAASSSKCLTQNLPLLSRPPQLEADCPFEAAPMKQAWTEGAEVPPVPAAKWLHSVDTCTISLGVQQGTGTIPGSNTYRSADQHQELQTKANSDSPCLGCLSGWETNWPKGWACRVIRNGLSWEWSR